MSESLADRMHQKRIAEISARQSYWQVKFAECLPGDAQRNFFAHEIELCMKKISKLEAEHNKKKQV
jgi:hypothetical protein